MALPDYPKLKGEISQLLLQVMKIYRDQHLGAFAKAPVMSYYEGTTADISTVDGEVNEMEFRDFELEGNLRWSDLPDMTHEEILGIMACVGADMGSDVASSFAESLGTQLQTAGRVVKRNGRPLDAHYLLEVLESTQIDFDERGRPRELDAVGGTPEALAKIKQIQTEDPIYLQRSKEIIDQKREEWIARESHRKLVD